MAPIRTQREYRRALKQIEGLMNARGGTKEGERLNALVEHVGAWEAKRYPLDGLRAQIKAGVDALERGEFVDVQDAELERYLDRLMVAPDKPAR
jgi:antitoxin component HigA of HigAB toxin-antitoxin module